MWLNLLILSHNFITIILKMPANYLYLETPEFPQRSATLEDLVNFLEIAPR
jgi:hypothetical protein